MPSGDTLFNSNALGRAVREDLGDVYKKFQENDKHTATVIIKDAIRVATEGLIEGPDWFDSQMMHIKAQTLNLSAEYASHFETALMKRIGTMLGTMASAALERVI